MPLSFFCFVFVLFFPSRFSFFVLEARQLGNLQLLLICGLKLTHLLSDVYSVPSNTLNMQLEYVRDQCCQKIVVGLQELIFGNTGVFVSMMFLHLYVLLHFLLNLGAQCHTSTN